MSKCSQKFRRALALVLAFVMAVSVLTVTPATTAEAASKKVVKKLTGVPSSKTLTVGQKATVKAKVTATKKVAKGDLQVSVKSNNKAVASVKVTKKPTKKAKSGKTEFTVTGVKAGTATITVKTKATDKKNKKVTKKIKVTVKDKTVAPQDVQVSSVSATINPSTIKIGETAKVTATVAPANAKNKTLSYSSSDASIASVDNKGLVVGLSAGTAVITVKSVNGKTATVKVNVTAIPVASITFEQTNVEVTEGSKTNLAVNVSPANATNKNLEWKSSDPTKATVDSDGIVTAIAEGKTTITAVAKDGSGVAASCTVVITKEVVLADGIQLSVKGALKDNAGNVYHENTTVLGSDLELDVKLTSATGVKLGGEYVTIKVEPISGNCSTDGFTVTSGNNEYKLGANVKGQTNEEGVARFVIGSDIEKAHGDIQSLKVTATHNFANATKTEVCSVSFGELTLSNLHVKNPEDIEPANGVKNSGLYNANREVQYVTNQRITDPKVGIDHTVKFEVIPRLYTPYAETAVDENINVNVNKSIETTSVYNALEDVATDIITATIPVGTEKIDLNFGQIGLSKYSKMFVTIIDEDLNNCLAGVNPKQWTFTKDDNSKSPVTKTITGFSCKKAATVSVIIVTEGQVNTANTGCTLNSIDVTRTKDFSSIDYAYYEDLVGVVEWSKVSSSDVNYSEMTEDEIKALLPAGEAYTAADATGYTYAAKYPAAPFVGNAILSVKDNSTNDVVAYFSLPTVIGNDDKAKVVTDNLTRNRVKLGKESATANVGTIEPDDNIVMVNSSQEGTTYLKAYININTIEEKLRPTLYTAVQWDVDATREEEEVVNDYYALNGQDIKIDCQLKSGSSNASTGTPVNISYTNAVGTSTIPSSMLMDTTGKASLSINGGTKDDSCVEYLGFTPAKGTEATLSINGNVIGTATEEKPLHINLYWFKLGLAYLNEVGNAWDSTYATDTAVQSEYPVGNDKWNVKFLPIAQNTKVFTWDGFSGAAGTFAGLTGLNVEYTKTTQNDSVTFEQSNAMAVLSSNTIGHTDMLGKLIMKGEVDLSKVVLYYYDEEGKKQSITNSGIGNADVVEPKMTLPIEWVNDDVVNVEMILPNGNSVAKADGSSEVYVRFTDGKNNPVSGKTLASATTSDGKTVKISGPSNEKGYIVLTVPVATGDSHYVEIKVTDKADVMRKLISYTDDTTFGLANDGIAYNSDNKTVTLKLDAAINTDCVITKNHILIKDKDANTIDIVQSVSYVGDTITVVLKESLPVNATYTISLVTDEKSDMHTQIVNKNGKVVDSSAIAIPKN